MNASALMLSSRFAKKSIRDNQKRPEVAESAVSQPGAAAQPEKRWQWFLPTVGSVIAFLPVFLLASDYAQSLLRKHIMGYDWLYLDGYFLGLPVSVVALNVLLFAALTVSVWQLLRKHRWGAAVTFGVFWFFLLGFFPNDYARATLQCFLPAVFTLAVSLWLTKK